MLKYIILSLLGSCNIGIGLKVIKLTSENFFTFLGYFVGLILLINGILLFLYGFSKIYKFK